MRRILRKYRFRYRYFLIARSFEIEAFSTIEAIDKFYANFPYAKIVSIREVTYESK